MRFIMETITGRKGIKSFETLNEYIDYMTKHGDKIKTIVEADLPYDDKPVSVATPSQSNGWEQVNKATFGDVIKKAEKGDCVLPHKAASVFKDEAKFEPSKSSEKEDSQESSNPSLEKDLPKFEYKENSEESTPKTEEKSDSESKTEEKENSEEDENNKKEIKESLEDEKLDEAGTFDNIKDKAHNAIVNLKQSLGLSLSDKELSEWINEYFVYVFMIINHKININHPEFKRITNELIKTDSKMKNVHNVVMSILESSYYKGFPPDNIERLMKSRLIKLGIDESIIDKAYNTFEEEEKVKIDNNIEKDIAETLRIAGVQLNETRPDKEDFLNSNTQHVDDNVLQELYDIIEEQMGDDYLSEFNEIDMDELQDCVKDFGNEIDGFDSSYANEYAIALKQMWKNKYWEKEELDDVEETLNHDEDGEIDEKSGKEKLFEEDPYSKDDGSPEYAKRQVELWQDAMFSNENADDFYYTNGHRDRDERNLNYWKKEVEKRSSKTEDDPFAALYAHNKEFLKNNNIEHELGEKFINNENGKIYKIKSVITDKESGKSEYVLRNEETYEDENINDEELNSKFRPL